ncbi:MAG: hypothetical protein ABFD50_20015 [Smithella sp.]
MDDVSLKEYIELLVHALEDKIETINKLNQVAIDKAMDTNNIRLDNMNEFRGQIKDREATYLSKAEFEQYTKGQNSRIEIVNEKIKTFELDRAEMAGKASVNSTIISNVASLVALAISIVTLIKLLN